PRPPLSFHKIAATAPAYSLSPGESVIALPKSAELSHAERPPKPVPPEPDPSETQTSDAGPAWTPSMEASRIELKQGDAVPAELKSLLTEAAATAPVPASTVETKPPELAREMAAKPADAKVAEAAPVEVKTAEPPRAEPALPPVKVAEVSVV